ncbi:MAG: M56 family metallopeptidase [Anaerorhabdus sp.]|uniref:M56 family metallopeptidase n=1 Tax=Anaerorhabdus sp. TaxID=1872524 RepID=UPI002FC5CEE0
MEKGMTMLLEVSFMMSILILGMILLKPIFNKKYGIRMRYFIWLFITLRLLIPVNVSLPKAVEIEIPTRQTSFVMPIREVTEPIDNNAIQKDVVINDTLAPTKEVLAEPTSIMISSLSILFVVWIIGVVCTMGYQFIKYRIFIYKVKRSSHEISTNINHLIHELQYKYPCLSKIKIVENENVTSPMLMGVIHPIIVITDSTLPEKQLSIILEHELVHHTRHDLYYKLLLLIVQCIHWFNPIVYLMVKEVNNDIEFSCDEQVLNNSTIAFRKEYGNTILTLLKSNTSKQSSSLTTNFNGNKKVVKERFNMLIDTRKKSKGIKIIILSLLLISIVASLISCSKQERLSDNVSVKETEQTVNYQFYNDLQLIFKKSDQVTIDAIASMTEANAKYTTFVVRAKNEYERDVELKMAVVQFNASMDNPTNEMKQLKDYEHVYFMNNEYGIYYQTNYRFETFVDMKQLFNLSYKETIITEENIDDNVNVCSIVIPKEGYTTEITLAEKTENLSIDNFYKNFGDNISKGELPYAYKLNNELIEKCKLNHMQNDMYVAPDWINPINGYDDYLKSLKNPQYVIYHLENNYLVGNDEIIELKDDTSLEKVNVVFTDDYSNELNKYKIDFELIDGVKRYILEDDLVISYPIDISDKVQISYKKQTGEIWEYFELSNGKKIPLDYSHEEANIRNSYLISMSSLLMDFPDIITDKTEIIPYMMNDEEVEEYILSQKNLVNKSIQGYQ